MKIFTISNEKLSEKLSKVFQLESLGNGRPILRSTMASSSNSSARLSVDAVSVDTAQLVTPNRPKTGNEKAPLLSSQRRLFRSLGGFTNGISVPNPFNNSSTGTEASGGYSEFGSSTNSGVEGCSQNQSQSNRTLGTFAGVFAPVCLSMFSALLFLRVGFIVGNAGLIETLAQFLIAYGILTFTVFSICAICTNGAVEGGGAYFMISRTLGPEFGGAIGTLFFFANLVSSALYITGCVEGIVDNFGPNGNISDSIPNNRWWRFLYCSGINVLNLIVCLIGAQLFAKTSAAILTIVGASLLTVIISYFRPGIIEIPIPDGNTIVGNRTVNETLYANYTGFSSETFNNNIYSHYGPDYTSESQDIVNFAVVFGVLFSGVTGIMAGANMSGELKSPGKSIPKGTLSAVGFTLCIYVLLSFLTAGTCPDYLLRNNYIFMMGINFLPPFVTIGILTATFSASLSNLIGSSRVLEAVARDDIFGPLLRFVVPASGNPIIAVLLSWFLVEMFLLIGSLNVIAQLNSVLFLLSYFAMNLACLGLELASAPNFRPNFKYFSAHTAFIGMVGTLVMMFLINPIYASLSIIACLVLVILLHLFSPSRSANWGSISQALIFHQVRKYLLLLDSRKDHVKFWRPQMLLLVANPRSACPLIDFCNDLKKSGLYVLGHVKVGEFDEMETDPASDNYPEWLTLVDHLKVKAFIELTVAHSVREGMHHLIRISGLGAMRPNTVCLGFHDDLKPLDFFSGDASSPISYKTDKFDRSFTLRSKQDSRLTVEEHIEMIKDIIKMNKNICLCRNMILLDKQKIAKSKNMFIDVWPINFFSGDPNSLMDPTSLFLLQLACILNMVQTWKYLTLRVFLCCTASSTESASREEELRRMLHLLRIKARIVIVSWDKVLSLQLPQGFPPDKADAVTSNPQWPLRTISSDYISGVNGLIREHSVSTAVNFLYLPEPMTMDSKEYQIYYNHLSTLTNNLGPTVLTYGISPVTSTSI